MKDSIRVALYHHNRDTAWINYHVDFIQRWYADEYPIVDVKVLQDQPTCGQRYNVAYFDEKIYPSYVDECIIPGVVLHPKDVFRIEEHPHNVTRYVRTSGYKRDFRTPEERVNSWIDEKGI